MEAQSTLRRACRAAHQLHQNKTEPSWIWVIIVVALATCAKAQAADYSSWNNRDLVELYTFYDMLCRGLDDKDVIHEGCKDRKELVKVIVARGYCSVGYDYDSTRWKKGVASRSRRRSAAPCR
jgi:hypothetical protein